MASQDKRMNIYAFQLSKQTSVWNCVESFTIVNKLISIINQELFRDLAISEDNNN